MLDGLREKPGNPRLTLEERIAEGALVSLSWFQDKELNIEIDLALRLFSRPSAERVCPGIRPPLSMWAESAADRERLGEWLCDFSRREEGLDAKIRRLESSPEPVPSEAIINKNRELADLYSQRAALQAEWRRVAEDGFIVEGPESEAAGGGKKQVPSTKGRSEFSQAMIYRAWKLKTSDFPKVWRSFLEEPPAGFTVKAAQRQNGRPKFVEDGIGGKEIKWDAANKAFKRARTAGALPPENSAG